MSDVTRILSQIESGDPAAASQLLPLVYDELRKLAAAKLAHEKPGQTLQASSTVHEAYVRLVGGGQERGRSQRSDVGRRRADFRSPTSDFRPVEQSGPFFRRGCRGDAADSGLRTREGNPQQAAGIAALNCLTWRQSQGPDLDLIALSESLDKLQTKDPRAAELVKLRFFAGLTRQQAADALGISVATADNDWAYARGWLKAELAGTSGSG
jgi:DNA-directed RNA polymerase specialized sigma24 family protein